MAAEGDAGLADWLRLPHAEITNPSVTATHRWTVRFLAFDEASSAGGIVARAR
jgi:hypothetical protein